MYAFVNPFSEGTSRGAVSGVDRYVRLALPLVSSVTPVTHLRRPRDLTKVQFREFVREELSALRQVHGQLVVEAPETAASTLLARDLDLSIHVRCHCPSALAQHYDQQKIDHASLEEEISALHACNEISVPSSYLGELLQPLLPLRRIHLYPNPPPPRTPPAPKEIDAIFLARAQHLKGIDLLSDLLRGWPAQSRVLVAGFACDQLRLKKGIRCHVELHGELTPEDAYAQLARAKVLLHLSRFESFGMTLVEAVAAQTPSVSWPTGAATLLDSFGVCKTVAANDMAAFSCAAQEYVTNPPAPEAFARAHAQLVRGFTAGFQAILAKGGPPPTPFKHNLLLQNLLYEDMSIEKRTPGSSWSRKLRKLKRDPSAFFRDSKIRALGTQLLEQTLPSSQTKELTSPRTSPANRSQEAAPSITYPRVLSASQEPRVLADVFLSPDGALQLENWTKKIAEPCLASAIFCTRDDQRLIHHPLFKEACVDKSFVGFRDRYLFAVRHDLGKDFRSLRELERLFLANEKGWKKLPLSGIRNAIFLNPKDILPVLIQALHPEIRVIVLLDAAPARFLEEWRGPDVLVTTSEIAPPGSATRRLIVDSSSAFIQTIRELIIDHKDKEKNMFLPVYGDARPLDGLEALVDSNKDGIIVLKRGYRPEIVDHTFESLVSGLAPHVDYLLLREESALRFQDVCAAGDLPALLLLTLQSGCRYEVRG